MLLKMLLWKKLESGLRVVTIFSHRLLVKTKSYDNTAMFFAQVIHEIRSKVEVEGSAFTERYYMEQGIKIFGDDAIAGY